MIDEERKCQWQRKSLITSAGVKHGALILGVKGSRIKSQPWCSNSSLEAQIPALGSNPSFKALIPALKLKFQSHGLKLKSQPWSSNPSVKGQTPSLRLKSKPLGSSPSLKAQIPKSRLKSQPWNSSSSPNVQIIASMPKSKPSICHWLIQGRCLSLYHILTGTTDRLTLLKLFHFRYADAKLLSMHQDGGKILATNVLKKKIPLKKIVRIAQFASKRVIN